MLLGALAAEFQLKFLAGEALVLREQLQQRIAARIQWSEIEEIRIEDGRAFPMLQNDGPLSSIKIWRMAFRGIWGFLPQERPLVIEDLSRALDAYESRSS